jgi:hypothetical protein
LECIKDVTTRLPVASAKRATPDICPPSTRTANTSGKPLSASPVAGPLDGIGFAVSAARPTEDSTQQNSVDAAAATRPQEAPMQPFDDHPPQAASFQSPNYPPPPGGPAGIHYGPPPPVPGPYPPYPMPRPTNTMAIVALVSSLIVAPLGIIFGHISLSQIKRSGEDGRGLAIAGTVIGYVGTVLAALSLVFFLVVMGAMTAALHRAGSGRSHYTTPTTSYSPIGVPDSSAQAIKNAEVGDCIRRVSGATRSDGTQDVTVYPASCGSSSATDRVIMRTNSTLNCTGGQWVQTKAYSPPIVLCLSKLR